MQTTWLLLKSKDLNSENIKLLMEQTNSTKSSSFSEFKRLKRHVQEFCLHFFLCFRAYKYLLRTTVCLLQCLPIRVIGMGRGIDTAQPYMCLHSIPRKAVFLTSLSIHFSPLFVCVCVLMIRHLSQM